MAPNDDPRVPSELEIIFDSVWDVIRPRGTLGPKAETQLIYIGGDNGASAEGMLKSNHLPIRACVQGNSPICGKANQEMKPTAAMREFCSGQPNAEVIPLSVIGHENPMIYDWTCKGKKPAIARQIFAVDARGFPVELWKEIAPPQK